MQWFDKVITRLGGVATTAELYRHGDTQSMLYWSERYGSIIRVRAGIYCLPSLDGEAVRALRVGGRLGCVSALAYHGVVPPPEKLHVAVAANTPRLRDPDTGKPGRSPDTTVIHWSRRVLAGDRVAVSLDEAHRQAASCRALSRDTL